MRTIITRLHRLEELAASGLDDQGRGIADVIRERWRRRLAAEGKEPEPELPRRREDYLDENGRPLSIGEIIVKLRSLRFQLRAQAEAAARKHD